MFDKVQCVTILPLLQLDIGVHAFGLIRVGTE